MVAGSDRARIRVGRRFFFCDHENELVTALTNGQLKGAGLDVVSTEPLPKSSPFTTAKGQKTKPEMVRKAG